MGDFSRDAQVPHLGKVGIFRTTIHIAPAVDATPDYADGDVIGGKMTLDDASRLTGGSGAIRAAAVYCKSDIAANIPIRVIVFNADPSASTFTENAAPTIHADDLSKIVGVLDLSQRLDLGTPVVLFAATPHVPFKLAAGDSLYAVAVIGGAANLGSTSDLAFVFGIDQD
jgi:hypothetical protein